MKQVGPDLLGLEEHVLDEGDLPRFFGALLPRGTNARRGGLVLHLLEQIQRIPAQQQGEHHRDHRARAAQGHADGQAPLVLDVFAFAAFLPTHGDIQLCTPDQNPARKTKIPPPKT